MRIAALSVKLAIATARAQSRAYAEEQAWQDLADEVADDQRRRRANDLPISEPLPALRRTIEERLRELLRAHDELELAGHAQPGIEARALMAGAAAILAAEGC